MSSKKRTIVIFIYCIKTDSYYLSELLVAVGKVCENHMPDCPSLLSSLVTRDSLVNDHLTKDKNGMLHSMFKRAGKALFTLNLPTDSAEEPRISSATASIHPSISSGRTEAELLENGIFYICRSPNSQYDPISNSIHHEKFVNGIVVLV